MSSNRFGKNITVNVWAEESEAPVECSLLSNIKMSAVFCGQSAYVSGESSSSAPTFNLDYNNPNGTDLPEGQYDLITCFAGAHHFPEESLGGFSITYLKHSNQVVSF